MTFQQFGCPKNGDFLMQIKSGKTKLFIVFFVLVLVFGVILRPVFLGNLEYSEGFREGNMQKLSKKGILWKTWEGEVSLWGYGGSHNRTSGEGNVFSFTVTDENFANQIIKHTAPNNEGVAPKVRMDYTQYWSSLPWRGDSDYIVTKVRIYGNPSYILEPGKEVVTINTDPDKK